MSIATQFLIALEVVVAKKWSKKRGYLYFMVITSNGLENKICEGNFSPWVVVPL